MKPTTALKALAIVLIHASLVMAQVTTATISGVIHDSSGQAVPGATLTIRQVETGATRTIASGPDGNYVIPDLALGTYDIDCSKGGFQTEARRGIALAVRRDAVVNFTLHVGSLNQKVIVTGDAPLVDTTNSSMGEVVERQMIAELPLNGRDYTQLTLLAPGVVNVSTFAANSFLGLTRRIAVAGARASSGAVYLLDGTNVMGFFDDNAGNPALGTGLGVDAIREFKVETNNFSPEYARAGASVINAISRSGTNDLQGSLYEYFRNSALDARNFFDMPTKPPFVRNQFGASLGGPIRKQKTFFFVNYEGLRQRLDETEVGGVPDAAARASAVPAVAPLLSLFPLPNGPDLGNGVGLVTTSAPQHADEDFFSARVDDYLSSNDSLFVRFMFDDGQLNDPYPIQGTYLPFYQMSDGRNRYATVQETHVFSSQFVNSFRMSFNRSDSDGNNLENPAALDFLPGVTGRAAGAISIGGVGYFGSNSIVPYYLIINNWMWGDDLNFVRGRHVLKIGFEWQKIQNPYRSDIYSGGLLTFNTLGDFLSGNPFTLLVPLPGKLDTERTWNEDVGGAYFWDSFKLRPNLTLDYGLRYEFITNPTESHGRFSTLVNLSDATVTPEPHVFEHNPSLKNLAPRLGFAWDVTGDGKTAVRGGFGIFYQEYMPRDYGEYGFNPPQTILGLALLPGFPIAPSSLVGLPPSITMVTGYNITKSPHMLEYDLDIQRELGNNLVLEVGGIFSGGRDLLGAYDYNQPLPNATLPDGTPIRTVNDPRPNPNFSSLQFTYPIDSSNYSALVVKMQKQFSAGSQVSVAYTWSHSLDTQSNEFNGDGWNDSGQTTDIDDLKMDYGNSTFDVRNNLTADYVYNLPFGSELHGAAALFGSGWAFTGIATLESGLPFSVEDGFDRANTMQSSVPPDASERPDLKPGFSNNPVLGNPNEWFNPNAFELQPDGAFGDLGRDTVRGPGLADVDTGFLKAFHLAEDYRLQFRFEIFNIFNHPNFAVPNFEDRYLFTSDPVTGAISDNPLAGRITSTVTSSRQLQFALRLEF